MITPVSLVLTWLSKLNFTWPRDELSFASSCLFLVGLAFVAIISRALWQPLRMSLAASFLGPYWTTQCHKWCGEHEVGRIKKLQRYEFLCCLMQTGSEELWFTNVNHFYTQGSTHPMGSSEEQYGTPKVDIQGRSLRIRFMRHRVQYMQTPLSNPARPCFCSWSGPKSQLLLLLL